MAEWKKVQDFDLHSMGAGKCAMTGVIKPKSEDFVLRGPFIEHVGYFDICQHSARELMDLIGAADQGMVDKLKAEVARLTAQVARDEQVVSRARDLMKAVDEFYAKEAKTPESMVPQTKPAPVKKAAAKKS